MPTAPEPRNSAPGRYAAAGASERVASTYVAAPPMTRSEMYQNRESLQYTLRRLTLSWLASEHELVRTRRAIHRMAVSDHRMQPARFVARSGTVSAMTRIAAAIAALLFASCSSSNPAP